MACEIYKLNFTREIIHLTWHWRSHLIIILTIAGNIYGTLNITQGPSLSTLPWIFTPLWGRYYYCHSTQQNDLGWGDSVLLMVIQARLHGSVFQIHDCQIPKCIFLIRKLYCLRGNWNFEKWNFGLSDWSGCRFLFYRAWTQLCWPEGFSLPKKSCFCPLFNNNNKKPPNHAHGGLGIR